MGFTMGNCSVRRSFPRTKLEVQFAKLAERQTLGWWRQRLSLVNRPFDSGIVGRVSAGALQFYAQHLTTGDLHHVELRLGIALQIGRQHDEASDLVADTALIVVDQPLLRA